MEWLAIHAFAVAFWASVFWGSFELLDRGNAKNTFGLAVILGVICVLTHLAGVPDLFYLCAWLVFLFRLVTWHHGLSTLAAVIVTAATVFAPYLIVPLMVRFIGDSELRFDLVFYGFPIAVFGTWIVTAMRRRARSRDQAPGDVIPVARVERGGRRAASVPAVVPVAVPVAPIAAPRTPDPMAPRGDKPTFLT
jgi:hypothetical protein